MFQGRNAAWWIVPAALMLASLYVPTLTTRFDFVDDGNLVYAAPPGTTLASYWDRYVYRVETNATQLGPFRPVVWVHWELAANTLGDNAPAWRCLRLFWTALAAATFLWFLHEFRFPPLACLGAGALALWNPWRNEIWTSLTLAEGVAMPYAVFALVAALRANRSSRPWPWVVAAAWAALMALGCKNTFLVLIPVQLFLRTYPQPDLTWRQSLRQAWGQLVALTLPLLMPGLHALYFYNNWQPGHYEATGFTLRHFGEQLRSLAGAMSLEFMGAGLALAGIALYLGTRGAKTRTLPAAYQLPLLTGGLLVILGLAVYFPFNGIAGRYNIPAAWGLDLGVAALLSAVLALPRTVWVRVAGGAVCAGLVGVAVANVGKQHKCATRAEMLWGVVEYLETHTAEGDHIAWVADGQLSQDEGVHVLWHLHNRGRTDLQLSLMDADGHTTPRIGVPAATTPPTLWVSSGETDEVPGPARRLADFRTYPMARKPYHCVLWQRKARQRYVDVRKP